MRVYRLNLLNVFRWPNWLQNVVLVLMGIPAAAWIGEYTSDNPVLLLQAAILILILIPSFILAATESRFLLPYVIVIWLVGPEIRRLTDWAMGDYSSITLLSLAPILTTSMIFFSIIKKMASIPLQSMSVLKAYLIPFVFAAVIGLVLNKLAAIYSIMNNFIPLLFFVYLVANPPSDSQKEMWIRFYVTMTVILSIYSWFQYLYLPPWDRLWMEGAEMASLGIPEPMQFRVFSTLNATGIFAVLLVSALIPAIVNKKWRGIFGLAGILLMVSALALTLVRASWVTLIAGIIAYFLLSSNTGRWRMMATIGILVVVGMLLFPYLPGGQEMTDRLDTFGNLEEDHSANVRWQIVLYAIPDILRNPIGSGFGSIGQSSSLNGGQGATAGLASVDNGYLGVFAVFGLFGGFMFFRAVVMHWRLLSGSGRANLYRALGLTALVQILVGYLFGGELVSLNAVVYWMFSGMALGQRDPSEID